VEPLSRGQFDNVVDVFALLEEVEEGGEATEVQCGGAEIQQVVVHPHQFGKDCAEVLAARREFDPQQFFDGVVPCDFIGQRGQVVHAVDNGDVLVEVQMFAKFFEAAVQIADVGDSVENAFTVKCEYQPQSGVSCGVLWPEIQRPHVLAFSGWRFEGINRSQRH
jgi:hypothetical protein